MLKYAENEHTGFSGRSGERLISHYIEMNKVMIQITHNRISRQKKEAGCTWHLKLSSTSHTYLFFVSAASLGH